MCIHTVLLEQELGGTLIRVELALSLGIPASAGTVNPVCLIAQELQLGAQTTKLAASLKGLDPGQLSVGIRKLQRCFSAQSWRRNGTATPSLALVSVSTETESRFLGAVSVPGPLVIYLLTRESQRLTNTGSKPIISS